MDASTILSRLQFAFTASYHYLFPQLTMGLALLSNAWMQHPVGYTSVNGRLHIANYWAVLFNPWIIGIVLAVIYFIFTYRLFWGKIQVSDTGDHE